MIFLPATVYVPASKTNLLPIILTLFFLLIAGKAHSGAYLNSAHGDSTYGVDRADTKLDGYSKGNCAHCHEQHASIDGDEPAPAGGNPSIYSLFYTNHVSQTDNFCFKCHVDLSSVQQGGGLNNRSYSYRAGNWSADGLDDILEAFTTGGATSILSVHDLDDISTLITGQWGYTADSNPCAACHNQHAVQGDPENASGAAKSAGARGYPLARPSQHNVGTWNVWGDSAGEKMSDYTAIYQAPLRFGGGTYEPDGSATTNGSNLTDMNTFCLDCHANEVTSTGTSSFNPGTTAGKLSAINWNTGDRHGKTTSAEAVNLISPYTSDTSYALACTDCHEAHGSPSLTLIRREVNNGTVLANGGAQSNGGTQWGSLCERCHGNSTAVSASHHSIGIGCGSCHGSPTYFPCTNCHYHGATYTYGAYTNRPVF